MQNDMAKEDCPRCGSTEIGTALIHQYLKLVEKDKLY